MLGQQWEAGTYVVKVNRESTTVTVDSFRYGGKNQNELEAIKDGKVIASWKYWDSIVKKA